MRLSDWQSAARILKTDLEKIDRNRNGRISVGETKAYLDEVGGAGASSRVVFGEPLSNRFNLLLGGDLAAPRSVTVAQARASLDATLGWAEAELPVLVADDAAEIDIASAKQQAGVAMPLWSLDAVADVLLNPTGFDARAGLADARAVVDALNREIRSLERSNTSKALQVTSLISQIEARTDELRDAHRRKRNIGLIGAMFGYAPVVALSLVEMQRDDSRLRQLNRDLTTAQADQSRIQNSLAQYQVLKATVLLKIADLEAATPAAPDAIPADLPSRTTRVLSATERLATATAELDNLKQQAALLTTVRDAGLAIGLDLDATLQKLNAAVARAEQLVADSRKATLELVLVMLDKDPGAAALRRLEGMARAQLKAALGPFLDDVLRGVPKPLEPELRKRLEQALLRGFGS